MSSLQICKHVKDREGLRMPTAADSVYREDCTQCFESIDEPEGLDVCLQCFNGGCVGIYNHSKGHYDDTKHPLVLNIRRIPKVVVRDEPPLKMSKLEIRAETEADRYDTIFTLKCHACNQADLNQSDPDVDRIINRVRNAITFAANHEVMSWIDEDVPTECKHISSLIDNDPLYNADAAARKAKSENKPQEKQPETGASEGELGVATEKQVTESKEQLPEKADVAMPDATSPSPRFISTALEKCSRCDLTGNLWLCLECGSVGCGRKQTFLNGAPTGNGHAGDHRDEKRHILAVKLGSLSLGETPDVYCYSHNREVVHPELFKFLEVNGLNVSERQKTEQNILESTIKLNMNLDFLMKTMDGKEATPLFGPGLTGLKNMGNTCYLASILQCLYDIPSFQARFNLPAPRVSKPAEDLETQLRKVGTGLLSGRYSKPDPDLMVSADAAHPPYQRGLTPAMFKNLIGRDHVEFKTAKQQDAYELMQHLLDKIATLPHPKELGDPVQPLRFVMEQRLQCRECSKVRYSTNVHENILVNVPVEEVPTEGAVVEEVGSKDANKPEPTYKPVTLKECLDIFTATEDVDLTCSLCGSHGFTKRQLFKTFPQVLVVVARKIVEKSPYEYVKVDVPVIVGDEPFDMEDSYFSSGQQPGEELLPDDPAPEAPKAPEPPQFVPNQAALVELCKLGISEGRAAKGLFHTGNSDLQQAMNWVFDHADDHDIDGPLNPPTPSSKAKGDVIKEEDVTTLLGFCMWDELMIRKALFKHGGNIEHATNGLLGGNEYLDVTLPEVNHDEPEPVEEPVKEPVKANGTSSTEIPGSAERPAKFQLQSIVCHKGSSIHSGHYVAFIRKEIGGESAWVLFNDEKVALAVDAEEMKKSAYIYFFKRA